MRFGYDVSRLALTIATPNRFAQQVSVETDLNNLFLVADFGYDNRDVSAAGYNSRGAYFRIGVDANLIRYDKNRNAITFGLRYGRSRFQHSLQTEISDVFGTRSISIEEKGLNSDWLEAGIGLKIRLSKHFQMGYTVVGRFMQNFRNSDELLPFHIPGFGRAFTEGREKIGFSVGFQYNLFWTIPFREKPIPIRKIKIPKQFNSLPDPQFNRR